jgi:hypothetical protein
MGRQPVHLRTIAITGSRQGLPTRHQKRAFYLLGDLRPAQVTDPGAPPPPAPHAGPPTHLIHGGATGIDCSVAAWARRFTAWLVSEIPAAWPTYSGFAGPLRNALLVRAADLLVSFGGDRGTANCVGQALAHGTPVVDLSGLRTPRRS